MPGEMTFFEHLLELRKRLLAIILSVIFFSICGYVYSESIINLLLEASNTSSAKFQVLYITSMFMTKINIAFLTGVVFSFPVILYQILAFTKPAFKNEMQFIKILLFLFVSIFLFVVGMSFGYYVLIPISVNFFNSISLDLNGVIALNYTLENYLIYLSWILIISSIIYQVPILLLILVKINVLNIDTLKKKRPYVVIAFFILAALLTPPDPFSQLLVALPMIVLYEITIFIVYLLFRKK